jgi:hypothetical protein
VGNNDFNQPSGRTATVDLSLNAAQAPAPAGFAPFSVERATPSGQDGPPVRIGLHADGTVYAAFERWTSTAGFPNFTFDVVVTRDDSWGSGASPFTALGANGQTVANGRFGRWNELMGQERIGADLAIAVDPEDSGTVWLAWCDRVGGAAGTDWTLHVVQSTNRGQSWSGDRRTITNAKNPALAINSAGQVGLLYQQLTNTRWVTQLEVTGDGWASTPTTVTLHSAPSNTPAPTFQPYIGDYARLLAVGTDFFGVFCGNNTPDVANFPSGVVYQRNANWTTHTLLHTDNMTPVTASIDPFFVHWSPSPSALGETQFAFTILGHLWHTLRRADGSWSGLGDVQGQFAVPGAVAAVAGTGGAPGETQFLFTTSDGHLWHTLRRADGSWSGLGDVQGQFGIPGPVAAVAAAAGAPGEAQFMFTTLDGHLWHTLRRTDGSWTGLGDVQGQFGIPGAVAAVAGAAGSPGETQWLFTTTDGHLWHTLRRTNGSWTGLGDVQGQFAIPGPVAAVAGASGAPGETQFAFTTLDGHLWHTLRRTDGSWTGLGDVQGQFGIPGPVAAVAGASGAPGETQFAFTTADGHLWHTLRRANGAWTGLGDVQGQFAIPGPVSALAGAGRAPGWT